MRLGPSEIAIWTIALDRSPCVQCLSSEEQALADRAVDPGERRRRAHSRTALRHILSAYLQTAPTALTFIAAGHGKPRLQAGPYFNLSHSGDVMLLAVCESGEVGVDVEGWGRLDADWPAVSLRAFSTAERAQLDSMPPTDRPQAALRGWVRKEAYTKGRGAGFAYGFPTFTVRLDAKAGSPILLEDMQDQDAVAHWSLRDIDAPATFVASLAHAGSAASVHYRDYGALNL